MKKEALSFLLGVIFGYEGISILTHAFYWAIIAAGIGGHFLLK